MDSSWRAARFEVKVPRLFFLALFLICFPRGLEACDDAQRLQSVRDLFEQRKWEEALRLAQGPPDQSADFDYYAGMALSRLERWKEARDAFSACVRKSPRDARFLTERAGAEYELNNFAAAKCDLRQSLRLDSGDAYVRQFLGTIYLLEGNVEAALKYWNTLDKPRLSEVEIAPIPKIQKQLLDRAVTFSPPGVLALESFLKTNALLENLQVFTRWRMELSPATKPAAANEDEYKVSLILNERNGWGSSLVDGSIALLSGLPYQTIYPSYFNARGEAVSVDSLARWDSQKRRLAVNLSLPIFRQPAKQLRIFFDARNENWNLSRTFSGGSAPITDLNIKRYAGGAELRLVETGRWDLMAGLEGVSREFYNIPIEQSETASPFFTAGKTLDAWLGAHSSLLRVPERRFTLDGRAEVRAGRNYAPSLGAFSSVKSELKSRWLPRALGDDYEFLSSLRGGATFGDVPLDQLYQLGVERDNDLWLRGHSGTTDGRKGRAPLGRRYILLNSELNKTVYDGAFFRVQVGPFFDSGAISDRSNLFGSQKWLFDTGIQARVRVLGSVSVLLSYGRDLRDGTGVVYGTSIH